MAVHSGSDDYHLFDLCQLDGNWQSIGDIVVLNYSLLRPETIATSLLLWTIDDAECHDEMLAWMRVISISLKF